MADNKGFIIIILVFIGVAFSLFLLVNNVNIQTGGLTPPFADGTRIRIRSLTDGSYLRPTTTEGSKDLVMGGSANRDSIWQLCQDPTLGNTGQYVMFYQSSQANLRQAYFGTTAKGVPSDFTFTPIIDVGISCSEHKANGAAEDIKNAKKETDPRNVFNVPWISFRLIESSPGKLTFGNVASNVYELINYNDTQLMRWDPSQSIPLSMVSVDENVNILFKAFVVEVVTDSQ